MSKKNKNYLIGTVMTLLAIGTIIYGAGGQESDQNKGIKYNQQRIYRMEGKIDRYHKDDSRVLSEILKEVRKK